MKNLVFARNATVLMFKMQFNRFVLLLFFSFMFNSVIQICFIKLSNIHIHIYEQKLLSQRVPTWLKE